MSVCLSVCRFFLSARRSQKPHVRISLNFLYILPMAVARFSSDGNAILYVLPVFMDDVRFSHNGANRPETKTTRVFHPVRQVAALETKSALSDCICLVFTSPLVGV